MDSTDPVTRPSAADRPVPAEGPLPIAGAGPAGLTAALTLSARGVPCAVYEVRPDVGLRFHGDYQGLDNWSTSTDVLEELAAFGIAPEFDYTPVCELTLFGPWGREHTCRSTKPLFYLVRRGPDPGTLDHSLKEQVRERGVPMYFRHAVEPAGRGIVTHGPRRTNVIAVGYLFDTDMADGVFAALTDSLAPKGYAYLLVRGGRGTLAVCLFDDFPARNLYLERSVEFFMRRAGLRMSAPKRFGGVGDTAPGPHITRKGQVLYAGEAAGFQDALFGFGIRYAMTSGHLAAQALGAGDAAAYDQLWRTQLGGQLRAGRFNRYLYARCGSIGYAYLIYRVCAARNPRDWLRRFYGPSSFKSFCFPGDSGVLSPHSP